MVNMHQHGSGSGSFYSGPGPSVEHDWPNFFRLVIISAVAAIGTLGNIFTISSVIVDDLLRKKGNSFLVSVTLADLLITSLVLPATAVAILAQTEDSENLCKFQYAVGSMSCVSASLFTAIVGIENFLRLRSLKKLESARQRRRGQPVILSVHLLSQPKKSSVCSQFQVSFLNLFFWTLSAIFVLVHFIVMPQLTTAICDPNTTFFKQNEERGILLNAILVMGGTMLVSLFLGGLGFFKCICIMRAWTKPLPYITAREFSLIHSNFWNWIVRVLIWVPSVVAFLVTQLDRSSLGTPEDLSPYTNGRVSFAPTTTSTFSSVGEKDSPDVTILNLQRLLYWPVLLPPIFSSLIYAACNKDFRRCYSRLILYCCCKTSVETRRPRDSLRSSNDVRVHIIPGYNIYSSGHSSEVTSGHLSTPRFNSFKCGPLMSCRREVYHL